MERDFNYSDDFHRINLAIFMIIKMELTAMMKTEKLRLFLRFCKYMIMVIDSSDNDDCFYYSVFLNSDDAINCWQGWWIWPSENIIDWKHIMTSDEKVTVIAIYNSYNERHSTFKSMMLRVTDWDDNNLL